MAAQVLHVTNQGQIVRVRIREGMNRAIIPLGDG